MNYLKSILYLTFLVPLTILTAISSICAFLTIEAYTFGDGSNDLMPSPPSPAYIESRLEKSSCSEEEKIENRWDCAGMNSAARASGGVGAFILIGTLSSIFLVPFLWFYLRPIRRRIFKHQPL